MTILDPHPLPSTAAGDDARGLLARVALGDRAAFAGLYDLTAPSVFRTVCGLATNTAQAEAVVHEIFLEMWRHAPRLMRAGVSPEAWLYEIAHLRCAATAA